MRIHSAFLANHAEIRDGLAFVSGGFPEWWTVGPSDAGRPYPIAVVLVAELDEDESGLTFMLEVHLRRPGDDSVEELLLKASFARDTERPLPARAGPIYQLLAANLQLAFSNAGRHDFIVRDATRPGSEPLATISLGIILLGEDSSPEVGEE